MMIEQELIGGCHCKAVQFKVMSTNKPDVEHCNCSICSKTGYLHLIVKKEKFTLLTPWENLAIYRFNTGVAQHYFCKICGVKAFYIPRSNPNGIDVNVRCIENLSLNDVNIVEFDGQNWEQNAHTLAHKTNE